GSWIEPPSVGAVWVAPRWVFRGKGWVFVAGGWRHHHHRHVYIPVYRHHHVVHVHKHRTVIRRDRWHDHHRRDYRRDHRRDRDPRVRRVPDVVRHRPSPAPTPRRVEPSRP